MTKESITRLSMDEILAKKGQTRADAPEGPDLGPDFWKSTKVVYPVSRKRQLTVRLDADVVAWFKAQGKGYQTLINAVLRSYYEAQRKS